MLGGIVSLVAAVAALWLVRERDIERDEPIELPEAPMTPKGRRRCSRRGLSLDRAGRRASRLRIVRSLASLVARQVIRVM